ncbi:MAG: GAF domain-containing protein, partial [Nitrospirota bacterium]
MTKENILKTKIAVLKEVAETIVSSDNLNSVSNLVLDLALNYTSAKTGSILLLDEKGELVVKAARGMDKDLIAALRLKIGENICGKVAFEKKPLLVKDMESDQRVPKKGSEKYETKSFICCPILMQDKLLGVINISDKIDSSAFTEDELDLITILANQAAITLENARLMSELRTKTLEMEEANKGLIEDDVLKTEFMAKISHELRTPLNSIRGAIYYLKDKVGWSRAEQTEFLEIISDETKKMISLFDGLLDFSRGERGKTKKVISINRILRDVVHTKTIKDMLAGKKISLHGMYNESIQDIIGDSSSIFQLFINLIEGSTKYTAPGDSIEIKTSESDSSSEVNFLVKGRQLPENELSSILDSRAIWSLPSIDHNSLKFYLSKKTAELHKG